jgi:hypothetical protein
MPKQIPKSFAFGFWSESKMALSIDCFRIVSIARRNDPTPGKIKVSDVDIFEKSLVITGILPKKLTALATDQRLPMP